MDAVHQQPIHSYQTQVRMWGGAAAVSETTRLSEEGSSRMSIEYMALLVRKLCYKCQVKKEHSLHYSQATDSFYLECRKCGLPSRYEHRI